VINNIRDAQNALAARQLELARLELEREILINRRQKNTEGGLLPAEPRAAE
jgi:hypothetical protein